MKKNIWRVLAVMTAAVITTFSMPVYAIAETAAVSSDTSDSDIQMLDDSEIMTYEDFIEAYDSGEFDEASDDSEDTTSESVTTAVSDNEQLVDESENITQYDDTTETPVYTLVSPPSITWYSSIDTEFLTDGMKVTATYESTGEVVDVTSQCTFDWQSPKSLYVSGYTNYVVNIMCGSIYVAELPINIGLMGDANLDNKITVSDVTAILLNSAQEVSGQAASLNNFQKYLANVNSFTRGQNSLTTSDASLILFWCASSAMGTTFTSWQAAQEEQVRQAEEAAKREEEANNKEEEEEVVIKPSVSVKGIDVSRWQGTIDWAKVKAAGIQYAIIRAGFGMYASQEDPMFDTNMAAAKAAGVKVGVYWYSYATTVAQAKQEAAVCLQVIKGYQLEYPVMFDIEDPTQTGLGAQLISDIIVGFSSVIESAGYYCGLYSYCYFLNTYVTSTVRARYDVWLAEWTTTPTYTGSYGMWQYTSSGTVNGISGRVDMDIAYKDYPSIMKSKGLNGY